MFKVFYGLQHDIVDRTTGNQGLIDIFQLNKVTIMTELSQMKGEKVDVAYIVYNDQLLSQLNDLNIKKISVISKGTDDIIVPKNFVKASSDPMLIPNGKFYNIILNNKTYKTDVEFVIQGDDNIYQDVVRNVYILYGNVITSTTSMCNIEQVISKVKGNNIPNPSGLYCNIHCALCGLNKCTIRKYVIKVKPDEHFFDMNPIITYLQSNDKMVFTNIFTPKVSQLKYSLCDHVIAGKHEQLMMMFANAHGILNNRVSEMRKKLRIEYTPEQILIVGYLKNRLDCFGSKDEKVVKDTMVNNFHIIPIDELGSYRIPCGRKCLMSGKTFDKELYSGVCSIKTINDI